MARGGFLTTLTLNLVFLLNFSEVCFGRFHSGEYHAQNRQGEKIASDILTTETVQPDPDYPCIGIGTEDCTLDTFIITVLIGILAASIGLGCLCCCCLVCCYVLKSKKKGVVHNIQNQNTQNVQPAQRPVAVNVQNPAPPPAYPHTMPTGIPNGNYMYNKEVYPSPASTPEEPPAYSELDFDYEDNQRGVFRQPTKF